MKIGEVQRVEWYQFEGDPNLYSVHTLYPTRDSEPIVLLADSNTWPSIVAARNGWRYEYMRNATLDEVDAYIAGQQLRVEKVVII